MPRARRSLPIFPIALVLFAPARASAEPAVAPPAPAARWSGLRPLGAPAPRTTPPAQGAKRTPASNPTPPAASNDTSDGEPAPRPAPRLLYELPARGRAPRVADVPILDDTIEPRVRSDRAAANLAGKRAPIELAAPPPTDERVAEASPAPAGPPGWSAPARLGYPYPQPGARAAWPPPRAMSRAELDDLLAPEPSTEQGWLFRGHAGPTFTHVGLKGFDRRSGVNGWGVGLGLGVGHWVRGRVIFAGELFVATHLGVEISGDALPPPSSAATLTQLGGGGSLTYRIGDQPLTNGWGATLGFLVSKTRIVEQPSSELMSGSNLGPAVLLGLSREWAVVEGFGLGAGVRMNLGFASDAARGLDYNNFGVCFSFSISSD